MNSLTDPIDSTNNRRSVGRRSLTKPRQFRFFENRIVETGVKASRRHFDFLTVPEFAILIRKGETTVRRCIRSGGLRAVNPGGNWLIPVTEAELFLRRINSRKLNHAEHKSS
jgi:excisionase family DNA binding protein